MMGTFQDWNVPPYRSYRFLQGGEGYYDMIFSTISETAGRFLPVLPVLPVL
jgi:hypothetical protein